MQFGVVLQTNPPAWRVVELTKQAELLGFTHAWTFDSHLLWQEPFVIYSQMLAATHKIVVGPMVTNPATRDWTVTASLFATLNEMFGNRTICGIGRGDSAVRVTNGRPTTLATLRDAIGVIRGLANGEAVEYKGSELRFPWSSDSRLDIWVAAYGPNALALAGEIGDGFFLGASLVDGVQPGSKVYSDEIFGPVLSVVRVPTYADALKLVNDNPYGNGTAIFTRDGGAARQFQFEVSAGMVGINVPIPVPVAYYSFGGWKNSLFGDLHMYGPEGVQFYTRAKIVTARWPDPGTSKIDLGFPRTR